MISHIDALSRPSEAEPRVGLLTASLVVAAVAVMAGSLDGPFLFDDVPLIYGNDRVHSFAHWKEWFAGTLWETNYDPSDQRHMRGFWRPIVLLSYAIDWRWGGGSPLAFHVTNLIVHAINTLLLFRVLEGWLRNRVAAHLGALLYAVHPVQTETVAWIAGRTDSLCVLGLLSAVLGLRHCSRSRLAGIAILVGGLTFAFGSKEAAVVFPVLAGIEAWSIRRASLTKPELGRLIGAVAPFCAISITFFLVHRLFVPATSDGYPVVLPVRALLPLESLGRYLVLLIWPDDLAFGRATIPVLNGLPAPHKGYAALGAVALVALAVGAWSWRRTHPLAALNALAIGAMLAPVMTIVWLGYDVTASPRFLYVPMIAVALGAGAMMRSRIGEVTAVKAGFLVLMLALGLRSFFRSVDYSDENVFWDREIASNERYVPAQQSLITRELRGHRPQSALTLAYRWFADPSVSAMGKAALIRNAVAAALALTPDVDREAIAGIQRFATALANQEGGELVLPRLGVRLSVPRDSPLLRRIGIDRRQHLLFAANAASRNGDDGLAVSNVDAALEGCDECWTILATSALIVARAGQLDRARELLARLQRVGPPDDTGGAALASLLEAIGWRANGSVDPLLREVGFFSSLGAFGRAYRLALPALDGVASEDGIVKLAELAALAGDMPGAHNLLRRVYSDEVAQARLAQIYRRVPWRDQPADEDESM